MDHPECAPLRGIAGLLVLHDDYMQKVLEEVQRVEEDNLVAHLVEEDLHSDLHKREVAGKAEAVPKTKIVEGLRDAEEDLKGERRSTQATIRKNAAAGKTTRGDRKIPVPHKKEEAGLRRKEEAHRAIRSGDGAKEDRVNRKEEEDDLHKTEDLWSSLRCLQQTNRFVELP